MATHSSILAWRIPWTRGPWRATVHSVTKSWAQLKWLSSHTPSNYITQYPGWEDPLEEGMETHSSIPAWRIPRTEEPGGLQSMGSHRVGHDWATKHSNSNNCYRQGSRIDANSRLRKYDEKQHIYMISKYHPTGCWLITKGKIATLQWISWQTLS